MEQGITAPVIELLWDKGVTSREALTLKTGDLHAMGMYQVGQVRFIDYLIEVSSPVKTLLTTTS